VSESALLIAQYSGGNADTYIDRLDLWQPQFRRDGTGDGQTQHRRDDPSDGDGQGLFRQRCPPEDGRAQFRSRNGVEDESPEFQRVDQSEYRSESTGEGFPSHYRLQEGLGEGQQPPRYPNERLGDGLPPQFRRDWPSVEEHNAETKERLLHWGHQGVAPQGRALPGYPSSGSRQDDSPPLSHQSTPPLNTMGGHPHQDGLTPNAHDSSIRAPNCNNSTKQGKSSITEQYPKVNILLCMCRHILCKMMPWLCNSIQFNTLFYTVHK